MSDYRMIRDIHDALRFFNEKRCNGQGKIISTVNGDKGPFCYILGFDKRNYYVMFKKDWFYSFSKIYKGVKAGIGQSFNMKLLDGANVTDAVLVVVMEDEHIYFVTGKDAMQYVRDHNTKRIPRTERHEEGSIPASMLTSDMIR